MLPVTSIQKLENSIINALFVFFISLPFILFVKIAIQRKLLLVLFFLLYKLGVVFFNKGRSLGMMLTKTHWKENYPLHKHLLHSFWYALSFSTLLFWIFFPFDIFFLNMLLQYFFIKKKGMTLSEYLSGGMEAVKMQTP